MRRLFFALWPTPATRSACAAVCKQLAGCGKPVATHNLHITLLFLGKVNAKQQTEVTQEAAKLKDIPTELVLDRLDFWEKPKVLCLTASGFDPNFLRFHTELAGIADRSGIITDCRPYKPHATLTKKARCKPEVNITPVLWQSNGFCLAESLHTPSGVEYRIVERWHDINA
ncbi:RNA 2',3'-cyclic phosphodiesterase [Methylomonas sp. EFPC3]|uniref:RNA 2',3'-cyclic phosphodiesterase n=1 Tax=Methylomonas sp. EFPC3 TaxID=3021710 RepID=UPI002416251B|nr:RNA 2',3'-cyclic phosphodiesterase [Methylomonas sp. EFPC3]WFP48851.1 RNA 2',3'-cyclic phosphodiesterase [Methylomonas sp. EFPC3]